MPGRNGDVVLYYQRDPENRHHRIGAGLLDGNLQHALDQLLACIAASVPSDPTTGVWYCERLVR